MSGWLKSLAVQMSLLGGTVKRCSRFVIGGNKDRSVAGDLKLNAEVYATVWLNQVRLKFRMGLSHLTESLTESPLIIENLFCISYCMFFLLFFYIYIPTI